MAISFFDLLAWPDVTKVIAGTEGAMDTGAGAELEATKGSTMQRPQCELYRPPDGIRDRPSCEAAGFLTELYNILEDFAPTWYTEDHHNALKCALEKMNRMGGAA